MNDGYINLANAIIEQAAKDYIKALKVVEKKPKDVDANITKSEVESFFKSDWFQMLTNLDGKKFISALQTEYKKARV